MKKKILYFASAIFAVIFVIWLCFVIHANKKWDLPETKNYSEGDTIEYESDIYYSFNENRSGYSAVLKNAYIISTDSFLKQNGLSKDIFKDSPFITENVYCVEIEFFNTDNTDGGIDLINMRLSCKSCVLEVSNELWDGIYPYMSGKTGSKLRENSSKIMLLPYVFTSSNYETDKYDD